MSKKQNNIILGTIVIVVLVLLIGYFAFKGPSCDLCETLPQADLNKLKNVTSKDYKAIANFAGYLKYVVNATDKKVYLPLSFDSVTLTPGNKTNKLDLSTDCAKISITISPTATTQKLDSIDVSLVTANGSDKSCHIDNPSIAVDNGKHYRCMKEKTYPCTVTTKDAAGKDVVKTIATLVISGVELETTGDDAVHKKGQFSTPADNCN